MTPRLAAVAFATGAAIGTSVVLWNTPPAGDPQRCTLNSYLPDPRCTPGATNPDVTPDTVASTICRKGWAATIRPTLTESSRLKRQAAKSYGIHPYDPRLYEGDHLIPLELGGAPDTTANLWDEPRTVDAGDSHDAGARVKDRMENYLHREVCGQRMPLRTAQTAIVGNWYTAWITAGSP